jgi:hypothetical protein
MPSKPKPAESADRSPSRSDNISLAPLTPDQALAGLLKVKPADVARMEAEAKPVPKKRSPKK